MKLFFTDRFIDEARRTTSYYTWFEHAVPEPNTVLWDNYDSIRVQDMIRELSTNIDQKPMTWKEYAEDCVTLINQINVSSWLFDTYVNVMTAPKELSIESSYITAPEIFALELAILSMENKKDERYTDILQSQVNEVEQITMSVVPEYKETREYNFNLDDRLIRINALGLSLRVAKRKASILYGNDFRGMAFAMLLAPQSALRFINLNRHYLDAGYHVPFNHLSWMFDYMIYQSPQNKEVLDLFNLYREDRTRYKYANTIEFFYIRYLLLLNKLLLKYDSI